MALIKKQYGTSVLVEEVDKLMQEKSANIFVKIM